MQKFSKNWKQGAQEQRIDGKLVGKGAAIGLKKGGHDRATSPYPFPMWVPPRAYVAFRGTHRGIFKSLGQIPE